VNPFFSLFKAAIDKTIDSKKAVANQLDKVKKSETISQFSSYYKKNETEINKVVVFGRSTMNQVNNLLTMEKEKKTVFTYVNTAVDIKDVFVRSFEKDKEKEKAKKEPAWHEKYSSSWAVIPRHWYSSTKEMFEKAYPEYIIYEPYSWSKDMDEGSIQYVRASDNELTNSVRPRVFVKDDIAILWSGGDMWADKDCVDKVYEMIRELAWVQLQNRAEQVILHNSYQIQPLASEDLIASKKAQEVSDYLARYLNKGYNRSILFYGPPGTGKSNIVKNVAKNLARTCFRIKMRDAASNWNVILNWLRVMRPDIVMIEDIDHDDVDGSSILNVLENVTKYSKLLLATANQVSKLNDAMVRPERFDELIEITRMEEEVLLGIVGGDQEILEIVRDFPIASTLEFMKRVDVIGKAEAIRTMDDIKIRLKNSNKRYSCKLEV
jgi:DNA replication protein DnaC